MEFYNKNATEFSQTRHNVWPCVKAFLDTAPVHETVIELGCGNGKNLVYAAARGFSGVCGIDSSESLVRICQHKGLLVRTDDILSIPTNSKYDIVLCIAVLHHLRTNEDRMTAFRNIMDICKSKALLTVWSFEREGASKPRTFVKGDNIVLWNKNAERYYYIFDKESWIEFLEANKKLYAFDYTLKWEEQNWITEITVR